MTSSQNQPTVETSNIENTEHFAEDNLPFAFARRHGVMIDQNINHDLNGNETNIISLICRNKIEPSVLLEIQRHFQKTPKIQTVEDKEFDALLQQSYEMQSQQASMESFDDEIDLSGVAEALPEPEDLLEAEDDAPIIRLINALLARAVKQSASDIHIEPFESRLLIRIRVDGILQEVMQPPRALAPLIASRIKVMAKLDIAEKRLPQDGRISLRIAGRAVDVRVSTMPSGHGERVVLRILDKQAGRLDLQNLGMDDETLKRMDQLVRRPHGIVLVTGPTGSGKTTTLYAALGRVNNSDKNIVTVEDPIEYYIDGIGQTQVNAKVDMTFARGLRAILRQDPDVVMVGEIRDLETVQIAVQASLTGHMVFSTLHTNTAVGAITRLRDMGVEPFLLSSSLIGVLAQRLIRLLCKECRTPYQPNVSECRLLGIPAENPPTLFLPNGCEKCNQTGYDGRTGIYELIEVDDELKKLIHDGSGEHELEKYVRQHSPSIRADGIRRILKGETSLEEVLRVTRED
ncbi:MAG: type II secretion system ATPase GspE [Gammaproteobacteria bacterium]|nr:type II secretion system ATPase GspE [Gammaproteobacteria bacterium]